MVSSVGVLTGLLRPASGLQTLDLSARGASVPGIDCPEGLAQKRVLQAVASLGLGGLGVEYSMGEAVGIAVVEGITVAVAAGCSNKAFSHACHPPPAKYTFTVVSLRNGCSCDGVLAPFTTRIGMPKTLAREQCMLAPSGIVRLEVSGRLESLLSKILFAPSRMDSHSIT